MFRFKKFEIKQEESAMKVGTDGVLLGAWCQHPNPKKILDVGTGTGLIALMLAQRFAQAKITAIEIDKKSSEEAAFNMQSCGWNKRLECLNISLQNFNTTEKFDLIVSNPPFFEGTTTSGNSQRDTARHTDYLSYLELLQKSKELLQQDGTLAIVFPKDSFDKISQIAAKIGLFQKRASYLKGNENSKIKRVLLELTRKELKKEENTLVIEVSRNNYTQEYKELCKDFYLKF